MNENFQTERAFASQEQPAPAEVIPTIRLTIEDQQRFADLLLNPPKSLAALNRAKEAHARLVRNFGSSAEPS